jgi:hypothetical protein
MFDCSKGKRSLSSQERSDRLQEREADHSPQSSAEIQNTEWSYVSIPQIRQVGQFYHVYKRVYFS